MLNLLRRGKDGEQRRLEVDTPFTVGYAVFDCAKEEAVESHIRCRDGDKPAKKAIQKAKKTDTRPPKRTAQSIAKGIIGTVKAEAGIDRASDEVVAERHDTCVSCKPHYVFGVCKGGGGCGCWIPQKIRIKSEKCPIGKW